MKTAVTGRAVRGRGRGRRLVLAALFMALTASLAWGAKSSGATRSKTQPAPQSRRTASGKPATGSGSASSVRHIVLKGENLYRISLAYGVTIEALCRANGIEDEGKVTEGQTLVVPVPR